MTNRDRCQRQSYMRGELRWKTWNLPLVRGVTAGPCWNHSVNGWRRGGGGKDINIQTTYKATRFVAVAGALGTCQESQLLHSAPPMRGVYVGGTMMWGD